MISFTAEPFSYVNLLVRPYQQMDLISEVEQEGVKNVFSFIVENKKTTVCFEKCGKHHKQYAILDGEKEILRIEDEPYRIQRCTLPGTDYEKLRVSPL